MTRALPRHRGPGSGKEAPTCSLRKNPHFIGYELAQRVPVRIALITLPAGVRLVAGRTATVVVLPAQSNCAAGEGCQ